MIKASDFSGLSLVWNHDFKNKIKFISENWKEFYVEYQGKFRRLIDAFSSNIDIFNKH